MKTFVAWLIFTVLLIWLLDGCSPWKAVDVRWDRGENQIVKWKNLVNGRVFECPCDARHGDIKWIGWDSEMVAEKTGVFQEQENQK